jgi:hypothetical protein
MSWLSDLYNDIAHTIKRFEGTFQHGELEPLNINLQEAYLSKMYLFWAMLSNVSTWTWIFFEI